jgi:hypothetical protein
MNISQPIGEILALKSQLEREVLRLVQDFKSKTGLNIEHIDATTVAGYGDQPDQILRMVADIKLP